MERTALEVYRRRGLPTEPGHYAYSQASRRRRFLGPDLTPEERWSLRLAQPENSSWRFSTLAGLGAFETDAPDLILASHVLQTCADMKTAIGQAVTPDLVARAVRLGAEWPTLRRELLDAAAPPATETRPALRFIPDADTPELAAPDLAAPKPKPKPRKPRPRKKPAPDQG